MRRQARQAWIAGLPVLAVTMLAGLAVAGCQSSVINSTTSTVVTSGSASGSSVNGAVPTAAGKASRQVTGTTTTNATARTVSPVAALLAWATPPRTSAPIPLAPWKATR